MNCLATQDNLSEDIDGRSKDFEVDVAEEVRRIPGVELFHDPVNTGKKQGSYIEDGVERRVQPDICGTYNGQLFVMDTKLKEKSYVDQRDVDKMYRDAEVLGATPVMVHSGGKISKVCMYESQAQVCSRGKTKILGVIFSLVTSVLPSAYFNGV